jgi:mono/diheme cytochrome c family protein
LPEFKTLTASRSMWRTISLARGLRNLAIPRQERHKKNPFTGDAEALEQGRQAFFTRCAVCHGIDGSGRTQIGLQEYPRVPDLRAPATQKLTDGEINYIIENGVQLSGMPALGSPHRISGPESWELALFVRSLRPLSKSELQ